jgi:teichuronic acid exporter
MKSPGSQTFMGGIGWMTASNTAAQVFTWIATFYIVRLLTPEDYALVGMSGLLVGIIVLIGDFGLNSSIIQKKSELTHQELSSLFWQYVIIGLTLSGIVNLAAPLGAMFWGEERVLGLIRLSSLVIIFVSLSQVPMALMQKKMHFKRYGLILSVTSVCGSIVTIILAYSEMGPYSLILGTVFMSILKLILFSVYEPFKPALHYSFKENIDHLKFGGTVTLDRYLWWYYSKCDSWFASKFLSVNMFGVYSVAINLASMPIDKINAVVRPVSFPAFSKINNDNEREEFFLKVTKYMAFLAFPIFIGLYWIADDFIPLVLGDKWIEATFIFKCLVLIFPLRCVATVYPAYLLSIRRADVGVKNMFIGALLATMFFAFGVQFGLNGLAFTWLVFYPLFFTICIYNNSKATNIRFLYYFNNISKAVLCTILMSLNIMLFQFLFKYYMGIDYVTFFPSIIKILVTILIGLFSYTASVFLIDKNAISEIKKELLGKLFN